MGSNVAEVAQMSGYSPGVHVSMCVELRKLMERLSSLIPAIESARPGCMLGIMELCSLNSAIEKAERLIGHFSESSKLYLVITGEASVSRCERLQNTIEKSLTHIQTMVPEPLATQILDAIDSTRDTKFLIDSPEEEARIALLSLLCQNDGSESSELKAFQIAAHRLHLTSSKALLVERRSVKKLLEKCSGSDSKKEKILKYLMHLLTTYGKKVQDGVCDHKKNFSAMSTRERDSSSEVSCEISTSLDGIRLEVPSENDTQTCFNGDLIPEEFRCPIASVVMYDPVVIASGQTFERIHIERWFNGGHHTCPKTKIKLPDLRITPNTHLKTRISQWCDMHDISLRSPYLRSNPETSWSSSMDTMSSCSTSFSSTSGVVLGNRNGDHVFQSNCGNISVVSSEASWISDSSHTNNIVDSADVIQAQMFVWNDDYRKYNSFSNFTFDLHMKFLAELSQLPVEVHYKALEDLKLLLSKDANACHLMFSTGFLESLVMFLKNAYDSCNVIGKKMGIQILLDFLKYSRDDLASSSDKMCSLLTCFLESDNINLEALKIVHAFCSYEGCKSTIASLGVIWRIIDILDSDDLKLLEVAVEILDQLSLVREVALLISSSAFLLKLSSLMREKDFSGSCLKILQNLCDTKEGGMAIANTDGCVSSIVEHLEYGNQEEQAVSVSVLLSLCSWSPENCDLVMKEGVIPSLVDMSVNGSNQGKRDSIELLQILRDVSRRTNCLDGSVETSEPRSGSPSSTKIDPVHYFREDKSLPISHNHLESSDLSDGSSSEAPTRSSKSRKKNATHKSSVFFGKFFFPFPKH